MAETFDYGARRPDGQYERHPSLPPEERAQGFMRPVRDSYLHTGPQVRGTFRDITAEEQTRYPNLGYVQFEVYPPEAAPQTGRYWTQADLDRRGCGAVTTMGRALAETYARQPTYYGQTFCARCKDYFPVGAEGEFVWLDDGSRVGT